MGAPICNINPKNPPPSSRAAALPSIPTVHIALPGSVPAGIAPPLPPLTPIPSTAVNAIPSIIAAINALRLWVIQISDQLPPLGAGGNLGNPRKITNPKLTTRHKATPLVLPIPVPINLTPADTGIVLTPGGGGGAGAGSPGGAGANSPSNPNYGNFIEIPSARVTKTTRIYDPNDPSKQTYVDVAQVTGITWLDSRSGQTVKWSQTS